jgi:hypothetical protein
MTEIYREIIDHPSAWTGAQLGGKEALTYRLTAEELAAIDECLARTAGRGLHEVKAPEFDHPALDGLLARLLDNMMNGRGLILLAGLSRERYNDEQLERIYWGLGTHWGKPAVQSVYGDVMGYVQAAENDPYARAYRSSEELFFHCDTYELVGLMCVQKAPEGGMSKMASTLAVHNALLQTKPDLLEPLYEGYYLGPPELQHSEYPVTDVKTPVFCYRDGLVSCTYAPFMIRQAAKVRGEDLPKGLAEALIAIENILRDPSIQLAFHLEPGEVMFWQNFTNTHARTQFKNSAERKRKLLRLWLAPEKPRSVDPRFFSRAEAYARYYHAERAKMAARA